ncbi:hypothetical protein B0H15DRAFT_501515 [Mycena belliarum]|uniref:Secreted protein n=1 Tax=Mycena belliarum TaxID=1033014 RepID=A0AAD6UKE0_9AGAR|nr:hypothetical protein B0H15DRAFT_501515 [Mycena belliae]
MYYLLPILLPIYLSTTTCTDIMHIVLHTHFYLAASCTCSVLLPVRPRPISSLRIALHIMHLDYMPPRSEGYCELSEPRIIRMTIEPTLIRFVRPSLSCPVAQLPHPCSEHSVSRCHSHRWVPTRPCSR